MLIAASCGGADDAPPATTVDGSTTETSSTTGGTGGTTSATDQQQPTAASPEEAVVQVVGTACEPGPAAIATGVALSARRIATVAHTFEGVERVTIVGHDGTERAVDVVWLDPDVDIAILEPADSRDLLWLALGPVDDGDAASIITAADGEPATKPAEVVRQLDLTLDGAGRRAGLELSADVDLGDSGAPVIGPTGRVVGMVFAADKTEPRAWAVAAEELEAAIAQPTDGPLPLDC